VSLPANLTVPLDLGKALGGQYGSRAGQFSNGV